MSEEIPLEDLLELRERLKEREKEVKRELEELTRMINILDKLISTYSYKPASELIEKAEVKEPPPRREALVIWRGKPVSTVEVRRDKVIVEISKDLKLPLDHSLVHYIKRELDKCFEEDLRLESEGKLTPDKRFLYIIDEEDGYLSKIEFIDHGNEARRRGLLGKIRWMIRTYSKEAM